MAELVSASAFDELAERSVTSSGASNALSEKIRKDDGVRSMNGGNG